MEKPPVAAWPGTQPCLFARTSRYPGRLLLPRHRRAPVSRYGAGHGHCRRGQAQQYPPAMGHGQPDGPTRGDRCQQGLQIPNIGAIGPRRRSPLGHAAGGGISYFQRPPSPTPTAPSSGPRGTNAPETVPHRPLKFPPYYPERTPPMKPHRLHPYPRAPTTLTGSAPRDRRMRRHQPHGTKLTQEKLKC